MARRLCGVAHAWRAGELEQRLQGAGFALERRWGRTTAILALVDRVEARFGLAAVAARDMGLDLAVLGGASGPGGVQPDGRAEVRRVADEVRAAVRRGDLRYFAAVARAVA